MKKLSQRDAPIDFITPICRFCSVMSEVITFTTRKPDTTSDTRARVLIRLAMVSALVIRLFLAGSSVWVKAGV
jgi:hypothetical protein